MHRIIKLIRTVIFCFLSVMAAHAQSYGNYDLGKIITISKNEMGQNIPKWNLTYLDQIVQDLSSHAESYPSQFDSNGDKTKAQEDIQRIIGILGILKDGRPNLPLMTRAAHIYSIAHNLDIPNSAQKANALYAELVAEYPTDRKIIFQYGTFLGAIGQFDQSLAYLNKALALGDARANFPLAMVYLAQGHLDQALDRLRIYKRDFPEDRRVDPMIDAIESGQVKVTQQHS